MFLVQYSRSHLQQLKPPLASPSDRSLMFVTLKVDLNKVVSSVEQLSEYQHQFQKSAELDISASGKRLEMK